MNYETALVLFIVFSIPLGIFVVIRLIAMQRQEKAEQDDLEHMFYSPKDDSRDISL